jgi:hypothetical protein
MDVVLTSFSSVIGHKLRDMGNIDDVAWGDLGAEHLGARVYIQWPVRERFDIGTICGIHSDPREITVTLSDGGSHSVARDELAEPDLPIIYLVGS